MLNIKGGKSMSERVDSPANPGALGLAGFGLTTLILNLVNAEIVPREGLGMVLPVGVFFGGMAQFMAGMWDVRRGDIFGGTCFSAFGAFWMAFALMEYLALTGIMAPVPREGIAVFLGAWGFFTAYATVASLKLHKAVTAIFVLLTLLFFLLLIGQYSHVWHLIAGWEGIVCALVALYTSAGILINTVHGKEILPLGSPIVK
jgi:succinate-acetate transporter protein